MTEPPTAPDTTAALLAVAVGRPNIPATAVQLDMWGHYYGGGFNSPVKVVREYLGDDPDRAELVGITRAYRAAINSAINHHGVYLRAVMFYAEPDAVATAEDVIVQAIEHVDLNVVATAYDQRQAEIQGATS